MVDQLSRDIFEIVCNDLQGEDEQVRSISLAEYLQDYLRLTASELSEMKATIDEMPIVSFLNKFKEYCEEMGYSISDLRLLDSISNKDLKKLWTKILTEMKSVLPEGEEVIL